VLIEVSGEDRAADGVGKGGAAGGGRLPAVVRVGIGQDEFRRGGNRGRVHVGAAASVAAVGRRGLLLDHVVVGGPRAQELQRELRGERQE
jgi:hypothetical protein